ncbi:bifunctional 2-polyprenyl-6-hydroxyphenol methylase/3-demethylubiquinol 3-O-methyltransferase UbiG [Treponema berlinense]|uniref:class I SAM-dependent methyltransferase n=1 Tax=Treponema berlinense TaxID=225004 RepID=UPI0026EBAB29|nr:class I SAM-dependent methyltransferase [Treponema berlinense]
MEINHNIAEYYDELYPVTEEQKVFYQKRMISFKKPVKFLRVGCGSGSFEHNLAREGSDVTGIETSHELIEIANRRHRTQIMSVRYFEMSPLEMSRFLGKGFYNIISILNGRIILNHDSTLMSKFFYDCRQLVSDKGLLIVELANFARFDSSDGFGGSDRFEFPIRESIRSCLNTVIEKKAEQFFLEQTLTYSDGKKICVTKDAPVYPLKPSEIEKFALESGFSRVEFFSDFAEHPFSEKSLRVLAVIS